MKEVPGTLRASPVPFGTTRWRVIAAASAKTDAPPAEAEAALATLCRQYWPPLYSYVRRRGYKPADAEDLTQEFFGRLLKDRLHVRADPAKGRFRSFLITLFKGFLSDVGKREASQKRGGGKEFVLLQPELDATEAGCLAELAQPCTQDEERFFERQWAETLVNHALANLGADYAGEGKGELFESLQGFITAGGDPPSQEEVASRLRMPAGTLRSHVTRLRSRYRDTLRAEVASTLAHESEVDEELRYLCQVLLCH